jgi:hypothetical protein
MKLSLTVIFIFLDTFRLECIIAERVTGAALIG